MQNDGYYWHPFRPAFRWPMRGLAMLILIGAISIGLRDDDIHWMSLLCAAAFLVWNFQTPQRRPHTGSFAVGRLISRLLLLGALFVAALTVFVYFTHRAGH